MKIYAIVKPGSSQERIVESGIREDEGRMVTIWMHARAHDGEANRKAFEMLSKFYGVPKTSIRLVRGETSKNKVFEI